MTDTVLTYKGRPITDLTKNELVDAMTWAFQEIEYQRERADRFLNAAALAEPEPEGPTNEKVDAWVDQQGFIRGHGDHPCGFWIDDGDAGALVRAALARWGK